MHSHQLRATRRAAREPARGTDTQTHTMPHALSVAAATVAIGAASLLVWWWVGDNPPVRYTSNTELRLLHQRWRASALDFATLVHHEPEAGNIVADQAWAYLDVARRGAQVICEAGFWRGMSAHLWLYAHNGSVLHSFDTHFPRLAQLHRAFGRTRLHVYPGSTRRTISKFQPPSPCDIVSIDASHDGWEPYLDLVELLPRVRCNATVFFDDTFDDRADGKALDNDPSSAAFYNACTRSYWRAVREGLLTHHVCDNLGRRLRWGKWPKGYCIARVVAPASCARGRHSRQRTETISFPASVGH